MTLGNLIDELEEENPEMIVASGFGPRWYSDRGSYCNLAFEPAVNVSIGSMLAAAKDALGKTMTGYKGGDYTIYESTDCYIGEWGSCGDEIGRDWLKNILAVNSNNERITELTDENAAPTPPQQER